LDRFSEFFKSPLFTETYVATKGEGGREGGKREERVVLTTTTPTYTQRYFP
jgi:hypothetical protein